MIRSGRPVKVASFGCKGCAHRWKSARGKPGVYQKCKECLEPCYPSEFFWEAPNKKGNMNRETYIGHNSDLCGRCIELGYSCQTLSELENMEDAEEDDIAANNTIPTLIDLASLATTKMSQKERKRLAKQNKI